MDIIHGLAEKDLTSIVSSIFLDLTVAEIRVARLVSKGWKEAIERNVVTNKSFKRKEMTENLISAKPVFINLEDDSAAVAALLEIGGYDQVITKDKNL